MESAGSAGTWCFQHQCVQRVFKQNKGNKDGLLHELIHWALGVPGWFSGWWSHTKWVTRLVTLPNANRFSKFFYQQT